MSIVDLPGFEKLFKKFLPFVGQVISFKVELDQNAAIQDLYTQTARLAILSVQDIAAFLWWAAHIAAAADDALGYSDEIRAALAKANTLEMEAWREWINVKHPADLQALCDTLRAAVQRELEAFKAANKVNLKPLEQAIVELQKWRKNTVTPDLKAWNTFYAAWKDTYLPPVQTLTHWLKSPATFADWAILPLIAATPSALRKPITQRYATSIEALLINTWRNDPQPVFDAFAEWLVSGK